MITEKDIEAFQAKLRISNNFSPAHTINRTSPFDILYKDNEDEAIEIILKSMYGPNVDDYNWIGLSDQKFSDVESSLERFLNLKGKWLDTTIQVYASPKAEPQTNHKEMDTAPAQESTTPIGASRVLFVLAGLVLAPAVLAMIYNVSLLGFQFWFALLVSPYSAFALAYIVVLGLLGEAADGFKRGWFARSFGNWAYLTLILAGIGELLFAGFFGMESYFF